MCVAFVQRKKAENKAENNADLQHKALTATRRLLLSRHPLHAGFVPALGLNACLAFFVNLTNFMVTKYTSALTLQVGVRAATIFLQILGKLAADQAQWAL